MYGCWRATDNGVEARGFLVKQGSAYEMNAELKKGLLTVNGAPIPIPMGLIQ